MVVRSNSNPGIADAMSLLSQRGLALGRSRSSGSLGVTGTEHQSTTSVYLPPADL